MRFPGELAEDSPGVSTQRLLLDRRWNLPTLIAWLCGHEDEVGSAELLDRLQRVHGLGTAEASIVVRLGQGASIPRSRVSSG